MNPNFHLYKMVVVQGLRDYNMTNRNTVAESLIGILFGDVIIFMTREAHFHTNNFHYWAEENPQQLHQLPLHGARVIVWCVVANFGITCPYFFENKDGRAVTATSARYVEMLWNYLTPEISRRGIEISAIWFRKDIATAHTARASMGVFRENFRSTLFHCAASTQGLHEEFSVTVYMCNTYT
jgi:hypothetical protein